MNICAQCKAPRPPGGKGWKRLNVATGSYLFCPRHAERAIKWACKRMDTKADRDPFEDAYE